MQVYKQMINFSKCETWFAQYYAHSAMPITIFYNYFHEEG